jgi:hypothetical protein
MIMHWQQWYFVVLFTSGLIGAGVKMATDKLDGTVTASIILFGLYVLYSSGFFTGGM